jgi:hypothetical protein
MDAKSLILNIRCNKINLIYTIDEETLQRGPDFNDIGILELYDSLHFILWKDNISQIININYINNIIMEK